MKIGLFGFTFENENKGCEALTYSVIGLLNELYDDLTIVDFTYNNENLSIIKNTYKNINFEKNIIKLKDIRFNTIRKIIECDAILDITFGDNFSDIYLPDFVKRTNRMKLICEFFNKNFILMPQTIGPFNDSKILEQSMKAIKKAKRVYTRDELSKNLVNKYLPKKEVYVTTDLAFLLPYDVHTNENNKKIGINVSGLLWNGGFIKENQFNLKVDYKKYICELIETLHDKYDEYEIIIIPHVIDSFKEAKDGDLSVSYYLKKRYNYLNIAPLFKSPIEAKNFISSMDFFVGARMHATIAGFSSYTPTVPFAYSRKFEGLYSNIGFNYIIDGRKESTQTAINKTLDYFEKREEVLKCAKKSMKIVDEYLNDFKDDLKEKIGNGK